MNKFLRYSLLILSLHLGVWAQSNLPSVARFEIGKNVPALQLTAPDLNQIAFEDELRDKQGVLYRIGVALPSMLNTTNAGIWTTLPNGSRQWQVIVKTQGAEALSYLFEKFYLHGGSTLRIQNLQGQDVHPILTSKDVESHGMANAALCAGSAHILTLTEPAYTTPSEILIDRVMYNYCLLYTSDAADE